MVKGGELKRTFLIFQTVICLIVFFPNRDQADTLRIQVNYRDASEILKVVQSMLSPSGRVVLDEQNNALIVTDSETYLEKVRSIISVLDVPGKQVKGKDEVSRDKFCY